MPDEDIDNSSQLIMSLTSLPPEVQGMIASFLLRPSDLNALSRTCKTLRDTSLPKLYRRVDVRIPARHFQLDALGNLLCGSEKGFTSTQHLRILPQQGPFHNSRDKNLDNDWDEEIAHDYRPGSRASSLFNVLIRMLITKIPIHCLQSFEWRHICPMEISTLNLLLKRQQPRCLRLEGFTVDLTRTITISATSDLEELRLGSLEPDRMVDWISALVAANSTTLQHLEIGLENRVVDFCLEGLFYDDSDSKHRLTKQLRQKLESCLVNIHGPSYPVLSVSSLTLIGLNLLELETTGRPIIDWKNLEALALKSCSQIHGTLNFLKAAIVNPDGSVEGVKLKSFDLRSDIRVPSLHSAVVADSLSQFLTSFKGLIHLGLLLEDRQISSLTLNTILQNHGPTLRRLIWDVRLHERTSITKDVSRAQSGNTHLMSIVRNCHLLEELGLSFDWPALGKEGVWVKVVKRLRSLKHLRTLHIRNLPPLPQDDGESSWPEISDDERSEVFVTRFVRALLARRPERPPILQTFALGIIRYSDICAGKGSPYDSERMVEFLKLRVYHIEYQRNFQGDCIPVVTLIAKGTTDAIQDSCHNIRILQSEWMA